MPHLQLILEDSFAFISINSITGLQQVPAFLLELWQNQYRRPDFPTIESEELPGQWEQFITCKGRLKSLQLKKNFFEIVIWDWL